MNKHVGNFRAVSANIYVAVFPWLSVGFLCAVPELIVARIRRGESIGNFLAIYVAYLALLAIFLYEVLCKGERILAVCNIIGIISVLAFHINPIWKMMPNRIYTAILGTFPYSYFLIEILGITYILNILSFHRKKHRSP